jgi:hypothetical protein
MFKYAVYVPTPVLVRAGSQDNLAKPSVVSGTTRPYKTPFSGCVGLLKDRRYKSLD